MFFSFIYGFEKQEEYNSRTWACAERSKPRRRVKCRHEARGPDGHVEERAVRIGEPRRRVRAGNPLDQGGLERFRGRRKRQEPGEGAAGRVKHLTKLTGRRVDGSTNIFDAYDPRRERRHGDVIESDPTRAARMRRGRIDGEHF